MRFSSQASAADSDSAVEVVGVDRQRLVDLGLGLGPLEVVEGQLGQQHVRAGLVRVDGQRLSGELAGQRRVVGRHRARHPQQRRRMLCVGAQRRLERPGRFPPLVLLEEQLAPGHVGDDVGRGPRDRFAEEVVGLLEAAEGPRRAAGADVVGRRRADDVARQDERERAHRLDAASLEAAEEPELDGGVADRALGDGRLQHLLGLGVLADGDVGPRAEHRDGRIVAERARQRVHLVVATGQERPLDRGAARRRLRRHDGGAGAQPGEQRGDARRARRDDDRTRREGAPITTRTWLSIRRVPRHRTDGRVRGLAGATRRRQHVRRAAAT